MFGSFRDLAFVGAASAPSGIVLPAIGEPLEGGFFAGLISHTADNNPTHALIVAPRATGATGSGYTPNTNLTAKTTNTSTPGTANRFDGAVNTAAMAAAGISNHPAAEFCVNLNINGYSDWYLPAELELDIAFKNLKPGGGNNSTSVGINAYSVPARTINHTDFDPGMTSSAAFQTSGAQAFADIHWSSTESGGSSLVYGFFNGFMFAVPKSFGYSVRAFRKLAL